MKKDSFCLIWYLRYTIPLRAAANYWTDWPLDAEKEGLITTLVSLDLTLEARVTDGHRSSLNKHEV